MFLAHNKPWGANWPTVDLSQRNALGCTVGMQQVGRRLPSTYLQIGQLINHTARICYPARSIVCSKADNATWGGKVLLDRQEGSAACREDANSNSVAGSSGQLCQS
jgi:hypothetical protein